MRLRIAPGSLWLAYTITSKSAIQSMLPRSLKLAAPAILQDDVSSFPTPKLFFNVYRVDAGWMMQGMRAEVVTIARHVTTGCLHMVVLDCLTNTMQWDPVNGIKGSNANFFRPRSVCGMNYGLGFRQGQDALILRATRERQRFLTREFAVDANRICYFRDTDTPYRMWFDEDNVMTPVRHLTPCDIQNTLWTSVRSARPSHIFCHEQSMTFDVDINSFI